MNKNTKANVTSFGRIHLIHSRLISDKTIQLIDNVLGSRSIGSHYKYSDILLSRIYLIFCGGNATEDVNYIRENMLKPLNKISIPSADTILRGDVELFTACQFVETDSMNENKININTIVKFS